MAVALALALVSSPPRPGNEAVQVMRYVPGWSVDAVVEEKPVPGAEPVAYQTAVHPNWRSLSLYDDMKVGGDV